MPKTQQIFNLFVRLSLQVSIACSLGLTVASPTAFAAKHDPSPNLADPGREKDQDDGTRPSESEIDRSKLVHLTPAPPLARNRGETDYFYRYRNALSVRLGLEETLQDPSNPGPIIGLMYWFPRRDLRGLEAGTDLGRDGNGTIHLAFRHVIGNERFRWFYKYGGGIRIIASDQLVTLVRPRNWQLRGSGGFEWTFSDPISFRADLDAVFGTERTDVLATLGFAFAW